MGTCVEAIVITIAVKPSLRVGATKSIVVVDDSPLTESTIPFNCGEKTWEAKVRNLSDVR
jgi:hypothetical protein